MNYLYLDATIDRWQLVGLVVLWATIACLHFIPVKVAGQEAARESRHASTFGSRLMSQSGPPVPMMKCVMPASR